MKKSCKSRFCQARTKSSSILEASWPFIQNLSLRLIRQNLKNFFLLDRKKFETRITIAAILRLFSQAITNPQISNKINRHRSLTCGQAGIKLFRFGKTLDFCLRPSAKDQGIT